MKYDEVLKYYGTAYRAAKKHGLAAANFKNWQSYGYIPIKTQIKIEKLTGGALKADLSHAKKT